MSFPLLRINLSKNMIKKENIPTKIREQYLGGTGFIAYYLNKEIPPKIDPLSSKNKIIVATGPLQGTIIPISGRYAMGAKSPLTGLFLDCNVGGFVGPELRKAGYSLIIIEGKADNPVYVSISDDHVEIKDASHLWGLTTGETENKIRETEHKKDMRVISIGPAGENLVKIACTTSDSFRNAGRGGLGAVWGSKKLKAIAIKGTKEIKIGNEEKIEAIKKEIIQRTMKAKKDGHLLHQHGTSWLVDVANQLSQFPTRNFQSGEFEDKDKINHETFEEKYSFKKKPCARCPIACSEILDASSFEWTDYEYIAKPEYETLGMLGGNCGINDSDTIIYANFVSNELGLDTISTGSAIALTMEAVEKDYLRDPMYKDITFGNKEKIIELINKIAKREDIGNLLAEGALAAAKKWDCEHLAVVSKGLDFAAWDPRGKKGLGLSYATAAVGASHLRGWPSTTEIPDSSALPVIDSLITEQDLKTIKDSLTICHFTHSITPKLTLEDCKKIISALWNREIEMDEVIDIARRIWIAKRMFNVREFEPNKPREFDVLPHRFMEEPIPSGRAKGCKAFVDEHDFNKSLDTLYEKRGINQDGTPKDEEINRLEIKF